MRKEREKREKRGDQRVCWQHAWQRTSQELESTHSHHSSFLLSFFLSFFPTLKHTDTNLRESQRLPPFHQSFDSTVHSDWSLLSALFLCSPLSLKSKEGKKKERKEGRRVRRSDQFLTSRKGRSQSGLRKRMCALSSQLRTETNEERDHTHALGSVQKRETERKGKKRKKERKKRSESESGSQRVGE